MNSLENPIVLIIVALIAVILLNFLLVASVQSHAKRPYGRTIRRVLTSIREPFQEGDSDLDELADVVEKLQSGENNHPADKRT